MAWESRGFTTAVLLAQEEKLWGRRWIPKVVSSILSLLPVLKLKLEGLSGDVMEGRSAFFRRVSSGNSEDTQVMIPLSPSFTSPPSPLESQLVTSQEENQL